MTPKHHQLTLVLIALTGCDFTEKIEDTGGIETVETEPTDTDDDQTGDETDEPDGPEFGEDAGPCSDGGWGTISDPSNTIHLWGGDVANAPAAGTAPTGDMNAPFTSWEEFEAARESDPEFVVNAIGLWTGEHTIPADAVTAFATAGVPIVGCGSDEVQTTLSRDAAEPGSPLIAVEAGMNAELGGMQLTAPDGSSVVAVSDGGRISLQDMNLTGAMGAPVLSAEGDSSLTVSESVLLGGTTSIWTTGGVTSLTVNNVEISGPQEAGIWTSGGVTSLIDVRINNVSSAPGLVTDRDGWGLVVSGNDVVVHNVTIDGAVRGGIVAAIDGVASFKNIKVSNIIEGSDGSWGRGFHVEGIDGGGEANIENIEIENVKEAGMFVQNLADAYIENVSINNVEAVAGEDGESPRGGDGLVVLQEVSEELAYLVDITDVYMQLSGENSFRSIARAGIIAHCSHLVLDTEPVVMDAGLVGDYGSIFSQSAAVVDLAYAAEEPDPGDADGGDGEDHELGSDGGDDGDGGDAYGDADGEAEGGGDYGGSESGAASEDTDGGDGTGTEGGDDDESASPGVDERSDEDSLDLDSSGFGFGSTR